MSAQLAQEIGVFGRAQCEDLCTEAVRELNGEVANPTACAKD
jgi:hypothetical protein